MTNEDPITDVVADEDDVCEDEAVDDDENVVAGIDFNFDNLTREQEIAKGRKIAEAIRQLPDYPGKIPYLEELTVAIDEMERACRAEQFAEYEHQVALRELREAERVYWKAIKDQPRH